MWNVLERFVLFSVSDHSQGEEERSHGGSGLNLRGRAGGRGGEQEGGGLREEGEGEGEGKRPGILRNAPEKVNSDQVRLPPL